MGRDLRRYSRETNVRLIAGGILLLFIIGDGLIYVVYGQNAALSGLVCLFVGFFPLVLIYLSLVAMGWIAGRVNRD